MTVRQVLRPAAPPPPCNGRRHAFTSSPPSPSPTTAARLLRPARHRCSNSDTLDSTAAAALLSFLSVVLLRWSSAGNQRREGGRSVSVLVNLVGRRERWRLGRGTVKAVVKCLGILLGFCDLENWDSSN
ncbi:hypothetical protein CFP56_001744 [Quercus suber]|uniref:RRP12 N-terminal HEAT domain-containing protein n=1 Tax=Quercus suber TaxID=58331 RepID=A0AAW0ILY8_QUESU